MKKSAPAATKAAQTAAHAQKKAKHEESTLDEALEESFPASDPVSISRSKPVNPRLSQSTDISKGAQPKKPPTKKK